MGRRSDVGFDEQIFGINKQIPRQGQNYLRDVRPEGDVGEAKNKHTSPTAAE
jgi:hypothetical protein